MTHKPGHADTRRFRHLLMAIATIFLAACGSREEAAFLTFSKAYSCPRSNMAVTPIESVTISELRLRALPQGKPPAAVQADPARLAIWQKAQDDERHTVLFGAKDFALFHVDGCGQSVDYACYCPRKGNSSSGPWQGSCYCRAPPSPITPVPKQVADDD